MRAIVARNNWLRGEARECDWRLERQGYRAGVACGVSLTRHSCVSRSPNLPSSSSIGPAGAPENRASLENQDATTTGCVASSHAILLFCGAAKMRQFSHSTVKDAVGTESTSRESAMKSDAFSQDRAEATLGKQSRSFSSLRMTNLLIRRAVRWAQIAARGWPLPADCATRSVSYRGREPSLWFADRCS